MASIDIYYAVAAYNSVSEIEELLFYIFALLFRDFADDCEVGLKRW